MSTDERRALAIILSLILFAGAARWIERPRPLLEDAPALDLAQYEEASRAALVEQKPRKPTRAAGPRKLDPNTATLQQLDSLPGIGKAVAERIIAQRQVEPFRMVSDLQKVRGVGAALAARLAPFLLL